MLKRGFTLIELLIVVAIIAILAAIAVPNFLEAQTRAKVARVKADFRAIATGIEAYRVDYNTYIPGVGGLNIGQAIPANGAKDGFVYLVRPVAYMTSIPLDPFGNIRFGTSLRQAFYELASGKQGVRSAGRSLSFSGGSGSDNTAAPTGGGFPADIYFLESAGPDKTDDTDNGSSLVIFATLSGSGTGEFPLGRWRGIAPSPICTPAQIVDVVYDVTNGTVSPGQIFRTGGEGGDTETLSTFMSAARSQ